ncbi:MAG: hypothetical protein DLM52_05070 [Chthoniobacterales bacterium]|nr:MAG: hypothetical protein DLM52_05070 [Chthoniobacterales bacterium]
MKKCIFVPVRSLIRKLKSKYFDNLSDVPAPEPDSRAQSGAGIVSGQKRLHTIQSQSYDAQVKMLSLARNRWLACAILILTSASAARLRADSFVWVTKAPCPLVRFEAMAEQQPASYFSSAAITPSARRF